MKIFLIFVMAAIFSIAAQAQANNGVLGQWTEPTGSTIEIYRCQADVCARLVALSKSVPARVDGKNPDAAMRTRPLCGLQIGTGFHLSDRDHAQDGHLYDPKSGKTYNGSMVSNGHTLKLRGYIGVPLFGRTEVWTRSRIVQPCS